MRHSASITPLRRWDPAQVGGYVLIGRLGAGAMGQVYLARSAAGRLVAVKTIKVEYAEEPDFRSRFAQEVAAARQVSGAYTAPVVAADPEADVPWLATAYVPAPSLSTLVRACGPLSVAAVQWVAAGCAEALESIHATGLVHRDLKPSNVLVSPDGPRVIDFGVARAAELVPLTLTRGTLGTPAYMAPEQARDPRQATAASDVYSLGATMLLAATGHAPYHGDAVMDVLVRLATAPPDLDGLPAELSGVVSACLERDPRLRPTATALLAHLGAALRTEPASAELGAELLPPSALALIAEYRRSDVLPSVAPGQDADDTFGSQPAGAWHGSPAAGGGSRRGDAEAGGAGSGDEAPWLGSPVLGAAPADGAAGRSGRERAAARAARQRRGARPALLALAACVAALALAGGGALIGAHLAGGPAGRGRLAGGASATGTPADSSPPADPAGEPTPGGRVPPVQLPPLAARPDGRPVARLSQRFGDGDTAFIVRGAGWRPGSRITISLIGYGASPDHPIADAAGTFSYVINEAHEFFAGPLPPGAYRVLVRDSGIRRVLPFVVNGALPGGPPIGSTAAGG